MFRCQHILFGCPLPSGHIVKLYSHFCLACEWMNFIKNITSSILNTISISIWVKRKSLGVHASFSIVIRWVGEERKFLEWLVRTEDMCVCVLCSLREVWRLPSVKLNWSLYRLCRLGLVHPCVAAFLLSDSLGCYPLNTPHLHFLIHNVRSKSYLSFHTCWRQIGGG